MKKKIVKGGKLACLIFLFNIAYLYAQPGEEVGGDPNAKIPVDGGVSLLAAAGIAYGAKKMVDKRKENKTD